MLCFIMHITNAYNNNVHSTINMTPVDASNKPDKVRYIISTSTKTEPKSW